ncbi:AAA family ATPase [Amycolatopsis thailandensis]|uniref:AAA family ATPase n=1 Tax=Amycolatopsis thailandensis TaxID=589330 RepID=UPI00364C104A
MDFVVIFGPPAVGKMTVGEELCKLTGFKLFHNHMAVEPVLGIFPFGSPPFGRLVNEFRRRVIEEAADADLPGLVFTYVWGLELPEDAELIGSYVDIVGSRGGRTRFVELYSDLDERLKRNSTELRLDRKPSKRDLEFSHANLLALDRDYVMNTDETRRVHAQDLIERHGHLRIDNTRLSPAETAALIQRRMPQ